MRFRVFSFYRAILLYSCLPVFLYFCISVFLYFCIPVFLYSCIPVFLSSRILYCLLMNEQLSAGEDV